MKILIFAGSLRKDSWNKKLAAQAAEILRGQGHEPEVYDIGGLPMMNEDLEKDGPPPGAAGFRDAVAAAEALVICTPEYNHSLPGPTKNAVDWLSRAPKNLLRGRAVAIMGASVGQHGTVNSQRELRWVLARLNAWVLPGPWVLVATAAEAFGEDGRLAEKSTVRRMESLLKNLVETAERLKEEE
jgi:chromate reductase